MHKIYATVSEIDGYKLTILILRKSKYKMNDQNYCDTLKLPRNGLKLPHYMFVYIGNSYT